MEEKVEKTEEKKSLFSPTNIAIGLFVVSLILFSGYYFTSRNKKVTDSTLPEDSTVTEKINMQEDKQPATDSANMDFSDYENVGELIVEDIQVGNGDEVKEGNLAIVHYTGYLTDGTKFDSSLDRGKTFVFEVGAGEVIAGWDMGVVGMKVGGKRRLVIPAELGYRSSDLGSIPPNSVLVFDVELTGIE